MIFKSASADYHQMATQLASEYRVFFRRDYVRGIISVHHLGQGAGAGDGGSLQIPSQSRTDQAHNSLHPDKVLPAAIPRFPPPSPSKELGTRKSGGSQFFVGAPLFLKKLFSECCNVFIISGSLKLGQLDLLTWKLQATPGMCSQSVNFTA